jgi:hypothetical protein
MSLGRLEAGRLQVPGQPRLQSKILTQNKKVQKEI